MRFVFSAQTLALVGFIAVLACRRSTPDRKVEWKQPAGESAALLVLDDAGAAKLACLPGQARFRRLFADVPLTRILDVARRGGALVAGAAPSDAGSADELVLLAPNTGTRRLAKHVRTAHFSSDGAFLAYEVAAPAGGDALAPPTSYVLDLATASLTELLGFADPLWEADGTHLRGSVLRAAKDSQSTGPQAMWLRARWDRASGTTVLGRGAAQIPAPVGKQVAWSDDSRPRLVRADKDCRLLVGSMAVHHTAVGSFCSGIADERAVRWSPDGQWLAYPHPTSTGADAEAGRGFLDVIGLGGGRSPVLASLDARAGTARLATSPGPVWIDWSPSQRFLAVQDAADELRVYDFQALGIASLGKGRQPTWSPGGAYLSMMSPASPSHDGGTSAAHALVLPSVETRTWIDLGPARDARWLSAQACDE